MQGRSDEAWKAVSKLHAIEGDADPGALIFAKEEFYQISRQVQADQTVAADEGFMTLFTKPSYRKRMICAFLTMFGSESTGILVIYSKHW
jgi:hypothetical protein